MQLSRWGMSCALALVMLIAPGMAGAEPTPAPDEMTGPEVGTKAPDFTLKDQNGEDVSLSSLLEGDETVALVFYRSADW